MKNLSDRDFCTQFITPAQRRSIGDFAWRTRDAVAFTAGRIIVRGKPLRLERALTTYFGGSLSIR